MPKTKTNDPGAHHASSGALIRRFLPYLANYKMVLCLDLFCAALTTLCDIVLPKIMAELVMVLMIQFRKLSKMLGCGAWLLCRGRSCCFV